jgi:hypothetical protein
MSPRAFTSSANLHARMPQASGARLDRVEAAIRSLAAEARRLDRCGLEGPASECRTQLRYWQFVRAIVSLEPHLSDSNLDDNGASR